MDHDKYGTFNPAICLANRARKVSRIIEGIYRRHLDPLHITGSQVSMLFVLLKRAPLKQHELGSILLLEKSSVNRNLQRLIKKGWITKTGRKLCLSDEGLQMVDKIIPVWQQAMEETETLLHNDGVAAIDLLTDKISQL